MKPNESTKDWNKIKMDYIRGMSYREISQKYGVAMGTISKYAVKGAWAKARELVGEKSEQKLIEAVSDKNARIGEAITDAVEIAVQKITAGLKVVDKKDSAKIRAYMSALKDAKDMGLYRSEMDKAEQTARIRKLEKEASSEQVDNTITVVLSDEVSEYAD